MFLFAACVRFYLFLIEYLGGFVQVKNEKKVEVVQSFLCCSSFCFLLLMLFFSSNRLVDFLSSFSLNSLML